MTKIQKVLEKELERLVTKYGRGKELNVIHDPIEVERTLIDQTCRFQGEVINQTIHVYDETLEEALDTLVHEYFEYIFDIVFVRRHQNLFNAMIEGFTKAFEKEFYADKEGYIETLVKVERKERKKNARTT